MLERFLRPGGALAGLVVCATLLTPATSVAQTDLGENAALYYWRSFSFFDDDLRDAIGDASEEWTEAQFHIDSSLRSALDADSVIVQQLQRGAAIDGCDFGVDYELGFGALLPHLSGMRFGAKALLIDARLSADRGDVDGAVQSLVTVIRMSKHVTHDQLAISSLVGAAIFAEASRMSEWLDENVTLDAAQRQAVVNALDQFDRADPFSVRDALVMERDMVSQWILRSVKSGEGQSVVELLSMNADEQARIDLDSMPEFVTLYVAAYNRALEAWDAADPEPIESALIEEIQSGAFGPVAELALPNLGSLRANKTRAATMLAEMKARFAS